MASAARLSGGAERRRTRGTAAGLDGRLRRGSRWQATESGGRTAERRMVTVLFADLVGFTTLAEDRDPEDVRELLTRYFEVAATSSGATAATVEKFIGDAVMAVWGAPTAHEDDAERAVRAGLELVDAVRGLAIAGRRPRGPRRGADRRGGRDPRARSARAWSPATSSTPPARLQSVAPPGTVLVGEATYRATSEAIAFEPAGEQLLKGKAAPVPAWRALRVVGKIGGRGPLGRRSSRRSSAATTELRLLKELLHATTRERALAARVGHRPGRHRQESPGLGVPEVHRRDRRDRLLARRAARPRTARASPSGRWARWSASGPGSSRPTTRRRRAARSPTTLAEYVPDEAERRWIEPRLLQLLGVDDGRGGERDELFAAWRTFFERVAEQGHRPCSCSRTSSGPTPGLLDFIDHLLEWAEARPILIVTLARPELLERRPDWGAGRRNFVSLSLEPLPDDGMREAARGLVPGLPGARSRAILERAEGIPLYAVETVRMLLHDGRLEADRRRPTGRSAT